MADIQLIRQRSIDNPQVQHTAALHPGSTLYQLVDPREQKASKIHFMPKSMIFQNRGFLHGASGIYQRRVGGVSAGMRLPSALFKDLENAGVLITGGGSGIGAALVEGFAAQGAKVAFIDIDETAGNAVVEALSGAAHRPLFLNADLTDIAATRAAVNAAGEAFGGIRVLVNNAAWDDRRDIDDITEEYWQKSQDINIRPVMFVTQAVLPFMRASGGGSIINFSSIAYMMNLPDFPAYVTAKAGIIGLTKGLAGRLGRENIRVNALLPGMVLTERQKKLWVSDAAAEAHLGRQALKFSLVAEDMVGPCLFLASDCSRAMTAQSMIVDGGVA
jgi:NAD(P)-dependent dehydrogenase (short-subunit alcohol dehydrogenase family)